MLNRMHIAVGPAHSGDSFHLPHENIRRPAQECASLSLFAVQLSNSRTLHRFRPPAGIAQLRTPVRCRLATTRLTWPIGLHDFYSYPPFFRRVHPLARLAAAAVPDPAIGMLAGRTARLVAARR